MSESPWIALVVFGVPTFVISLICYVACCMAPADDDDDLPPSSDDEDVDDLESPECKLPPYLFFCCRVCQFVDSCDLAVTSNSVDR